ncbi:hypothetical protein ACRS6B_28010 [Nocardia asteroides]
MTGKTDVVVVGGVEDLANEACRGCTMKTVGDRSRPRRRKADR